MSSLWIHTFTHGISSDPLLPSSCPEFTFSVLGVLCLPWALYLQHWLIPLYCLISCVRIQQESGERQGNTQTIERKYGSLLFCSRKHPNQSYHGFLDPFLDFLFFGIFISKIEMVLNPNHSVVMRVKWIKCSEHYPENTKRLENILATTVTIVIFLLFLSSFLLVTPKIAEPRPRYGDILSW